MNKSFKGSKIKSTGFEDNMGCIYTATYNNIYPITKHVAVHVHLFEDNIYDKYTNPNGDILLEKSTTRFACQIHYLRF